MAEDLNSGLPDSQAKGIIWINTVVEETLEGPETRWAGASVTEQITDGRDCLGKGAEAG